MRRPDVHPGEMQDEQLDEGVASFLAELRSAFGSPPMAPPGARLSALFATGLAIEKGDRAATAGSNANGPVPQAAGLPKGTRRQGMIKQTLGSLAAKMAAGALGAALAVGGLGTAGALPGPLQMAASNAAGVVGLDLPAPDEGGTAPVADQPDDGQATTTTTTTTTTPTTTSTVPDPEEEGASGPAPGSPSPVPTSQSEAAHTHDFDEACGNHGAYVSHFARHGEEPQCAKDARRASAEGGPDGAARSPGAESRGPADDRAGVKAPRKHKAEAKEAKAGAKKAKAAKRGGKK